MVTIPIAPPALMPPAAIAAPSVAVTASVPNALLGGQVTVGVTVTNNTSDTAITGKGYNLDISGSFDSSLTSANGQVTFVSATDSNGTQVPVSDTLNAVTGVRTISFTNLKDLARGESYTLNLVLNTAGDPTWEVGQQILGAFSATLYDSPNGTGPRVGSAAASGTMIPLILTKDANQSTSLDQASGTQSRTFTHTVRVQNNYLRPTASVVVTDVVPDGLEYLGMVSGPAPDGGFPTTNTVSGVKTLRWTLGTLVASQTVTIVYRTGIRYDWYGTANGGTNRPHDSSATPTGTPIPNHTGLTNTAVLGAQYRGTLPATISVNNTDTATVQTAYVTLNKSGGPAQVGYGDTVNFSLSVYASQYYSSDGIIIRDYLPDGLTYTPGSASIPPSSVAPNADGTTLITWGPSQIGTIPASGNLTITIAATVDKTWQGAGGPAGEPIRANDGFSNRAEFDGTWHDQYNGTRNLNETIINQASVPMSTGLPEVAKDVLDPTTGTWSKATSATVGDVLTFRVRFNTNDGATALRNNITMGYTEVTDWLPPGLSYNGTSTVVRSPDASFSVPTTGTPRPLNLTTATAVNLNGLEGIQWFLGDVGEGAWWQATFSATVTDTAAVSNGTVDTNYWKLTGLDTSGQTYSKRDANTIAYKLPNLSLTKNAAAFPTYMLPGQPTTYTITVNNAGTAAAKNVSVVDTLPLGMRTTTPTVVSVVLNGTPLALDSGYKLSPAYSAATGLLAVDLYDTAAPAVDTSIPAGQSLVITYQATPDQGIGAGQSLTNTASVGYSTVNVGGRYTTPTVNPADPNTDIATKQVQPLTITKSVENTATYTVGDTISYNMTATVPAGTTAVLPVIRDVFSRDGVLYEPLSSALVNVSGAPVTPATFATIAPDPAVVNTATTPSTSIQWDIGSIDNSGSASPYVFALKFRIAYTGRLDTGAWELGPTNGGATTNSLVNTGTVTWRPFTGSAAQTAAAAPVTVSIAQPRLINSKAVITPGPYSGGMPITYETTFTNTGTWPAYQVAWEDRLPSQLGTATLSYVRHSTLGTLVAGSDYAANFSALPTLTISFAPSVTVGVGQNIAVRYATSLVPTTGAGAQLTNTSDVDWYSRLSTAPPTRYYQEATDTVTNDTRSLTIPIMTATGIKSIVSTPNPTVGDEVTYRVRVTVPTETILYQNPYILDSLSTTGVAYVPGSASLVHVSGSPAASATISSVSTTGVNARFNLGPAVSNASTLSPQGDTAYVFDVFFRMRVTGRLNSSVETWAPTGTVSHLDTVTVNWNDSAAGGTNRASAASTQTIIIRQPRLVTAKSFNVGTVPASGIVTATVTVTNSGLSTAFPMFAAPSFVDTLPYQLMNPTIVSAVKNPGAIVLTPGSDFSTAYAGGQLRLSYVTPVMDLAPGESLTYVYTCQLNPLAGAGSTATNTADADWSSMPEFQAAERVYDDSNDPLEGTQDTAQAAVVVPGATLSKGLSSAQTTFTVGEAVGYDVTVTVPAGTTIYSAIVTDTVVSGLSIQSVTVPFGTTSVSANQVVWNLGDVSNPATATATMHVDARVDDTGTAVASAVLTNTANLGWIDGPVSGVLRTRSALATVSVVEPRLAIAKAASVTTAAAGDTVTYTVTIPNTGSSTAYGPRWLDRIPAQLFAAGVSPQLVSVTLDGVPVAGASYVADFSSSPTVTIDFDPAYGVPAGSTLQLRYAATVAAGMAQGTTLVNGTTLTEYSSLSGTPYERVYGPRSAQATVTAQAPALVTSKVVVGDATPQRGTTVTYRFTVRNVGGAPAYSVGVSDTLPAGFQYVGGSTTATWPAGSSVADPAGAPGPALSWPLVAVLQPGQQLVVTYDADVLVGAPLGAATNDASSTARDGGGAPLPADASATIPADTDADDRSQATVIVTDPKVSVTKALLGGHPNPVRPGDPVTFTINIANTGDTTLTSVPLIDTFDSATLSFVSASIAPNSTLPSGTLTWSDITGAGALAPGASTTITVRFDALAKSPSSVDTATVSGAIDINGDSPPTAASNADIAIRTIGASVSKVLSSGSATVAVGGSVSYEIGVRNTGDTTLTTVPLSDTFDARLRFVSATPAQTAVTTPTVSWANIGPLAPGVTTTVTVNFTVLATGTAITDTATVSGATDGTDTAPTVETTNSVLTGTAPQLGITKAANVTTAAAGDVITYTVTIANTGDSAAWNLTWFDQVVPEIFSAGTSPSFVGADIDGSPLAPGDFTAIFGTGTTSLFWFSAGTSLPAGSTLHLVYTAQVNGGVRAGDSLDNTATVGSYATLPSNDVTYGPVSAQATVAAVSAALVTTKTASDTHVQRGETVTWTYEVSSVGGASARAVVITDTLPAGFTYVPGSTTITWPTGSTSTEPTVAGQDLTWSSGATLAPGQTLTLTFDSTVTAGAPLGVSTNVAFAGAFDGAGSSVPSGAAAWIPADIDADDSSSASVTVTDPRVSISKSPHAGQDLFVQAGQQVAFDIVVTNNGDTVLPSVPLTDTFDSSRLAFVGATPAQTSVSTPTIGWANLGPLNPGESRTVFATFTARSLVGSAADTATTDPVIDINGDPVPASTDTTSVAVTQPQVSISKTLLGPASVALGAQVSYQLVVRNIGDTQLTTVPVGDSYAPNLQFSSALPSEDASGPGTLSWANVGPLAPGAAATITVTFDATATGTSITNTATTSGDLDVNNDPAPPDTSVSSSLTVTAPLLTITKLPNVPTASAGDVVTYTVAVRNTGTSAAYNVVWQDVIHPELFAPGTSPALVDARIDGVPLIAGLDFVSSFGASPTSTLAFLPATSLAAGSALGITYRATVAGGVRSGDALTNTSTVLGYRPLPFGGPVLGPVSASATVTGLSPALVTGKQLVSKATAQRGDQVTWRVSVTNVGDAWANSITLTDTLPAGFSYVPGSSTTSLGPLGDPVAGPGSTIGWSGFTSLPPGGVSSITFKSVVESVAPFGVATNQGKFSGVDGAGTAVPEDASGWIPADSDADDESQASVLITNPRLTLTKQLSTGQNPTVKPGGAVSFDLVITNTGDTTATVIPLDDTFDSTRLVFTGASPSEDSSTAASLHWNDVATLGPNQTTTVTVQFIAAVGNPGQASNDATITGATDEYGDPIPVVESSATVQVARPEVSVRKQLASGQSAIVAIGDTVSYDLAVTNSGDSTLAALPLADTFDSAHLAFDGAMPSPSATGPASIDWADLVPTFGQVAPGQTVTATVTFSTIATGTAITDTATVSGATDIYGGSAPSTDAVNSLLTIAAPHLSISKAANVATAAAGDTVGYTVTIVNDGDAAAWNLAWHDVMDSALVSAPAAPVFSGADIDGTPLLPLEYTAVFGAGATSTFAFAPTTTLPAGSTLTLTYSGLVAPGVVSGQSMSNTATVDSYTSLPSGGFTYGPAEATAAVTAVSPALVVTKAVNDTEVQRGQIITYTISVTNVGDAVADNGSIDDTLPADLSYVAGSSLGDGTVPLPDPVILGQKLTWNSGWSLVPGQTSTLSFRALVSTSTAIGNAINEAHATGTDAAGAPIPVDASAWIPADVDTDDVDTVTVRVANPHVSVTKQPVAGQDLFVQAGQTVEFEFVVANDGDTTFSTVPLSEVWNAPQLTFFSGLIDTTWAAPTGITVLPGAVGASDVGSLPPGRTQTWRMSFTANSVLGAAPDTVTVGAGIDEFGDPIATATASANVTITAPGVSITKTLASGQATNVPVGGLVTYDLAVRNTGDTALTTATVTDTFDVAHLEYVSSTPAETTIATPSVTWDNVGPVPVGGTATVTATFRVTATGAAITDTATVSASDEHSDAPPPASDTNSLITGTRPVLTIAKAASVATAAAGQMLTYTVDITNTGDAPAWDIDFADQAASQMFDGGMALAGVSIDGLPLTVGVDYTSDYSSNPLLVSLTAIRPLPIGSTMSIVYTARPRGGVVSGESMPNTASVTSYTSLSGLVPGEGAYGPISATATVTAAAPAFIISKAVNDSQVQRGQVVTYTITAENVGDAAALSVSLDDTLPVGFGYAAGTSMVMWPGGSSAAEPVVAGSHLTWTPAATLQPGESATLTFRAMITTAAAFAPATNIAHVAGLDGAGTAVPEDASVSNPSDINPSDTATVAVRVTNPAVSISKTLASGQDAAVQAGQSVSFEVTVTNSGDTTLSTVPFTEVYDSSRLSLNSVLASGPLVGASYIPGGFTATNVGPLAPGATNRLRFDFTALAVTGSAPDTVTVSGVVDEFGDSAGSASAEAAALITRPEVTVRKVVNAGSPNPAQLGQTVSFDIGVFNSGDTTITSLPLTDTVDPGLTFISATVAASTVTTSGAGTTLTWSDLTVDFGDLSPAQAATLTVSFSADATGVAIADIATGGDGVDGNNDPVPGNSATASVPVYDPGDVIWVKRSDPPSGTTMLPGQTITYYLDVSNRTGITLPAVSMVDTVSVAAEFVSGSLGLESLGATSTLTDAADADAGEYTAASRVVAVRFGDLLPDATATASFRVAVGPEEISRNGILNSAALFSQGTPVAVAGPLYHPVDPIAITKVGRDVNGGKLQAGDRIRWTITVSNTGLVPTTNVVVKDTVPSTTIYVKNSITGRGADDAIAPDLQWNVGTMAVDEVVALTFESTVKAGLPSGTRIRNQATVTADQSMPKVSDNPATAVADDPTLLQTGWDERWLVLLSVLALLLGGAALLFGRRLRRREATA